jgi:hypothetical protein
MAQELFRSELYAELICVETMHVAAPLPLFMLPLQLWIQQEPYFPYEWMWGHPFCMLCKPMGLKSTRG